MSLSHNSSLFLLIVNGSFKICSLCLISIARTFEELLFWRLLDYKCLADYIYFHLFFKKFVLIILIQGIGALVARTNPNWGDSLEPLKTYTVKIKSSTQHGDGGTMETTFKTGGFVFSLDVYRL